GWPSRRCRSTCRSLKSSGIDGWARADQAPQVSTALREHGYSEVDIAKLWGANILRVLRDAEAGAR
ncbi:membrane dipeptidase, partial [Klebsiella pneumoniae]|uniref:membrane dipeptidase n=1 Tax=Klebsiella pneumoniae TaxID=573 RepID=UPI0027320BB2